MEHVGEKTTTHSVFMSKPEWHNPHAAARPRWEDDIEMDFREIKWEGMD
jgi:hypothetical protein